VERFGHSPLACDWGGSESQLTRFDVMAAVSPLSGKRLLDVGCGFGDFVGYLHQRHACFDYTGVDISPAMIHTARELRPNAAFHLANILEDDLGVYDVVTANGIFYLLGANAPALMRRLITRMFEMATEAVAFSSLSAWASNKESGEFYADPVETLTFCRTLTPRLTLRHDYHAGDFTVYLYK
jgi:trans-aconitate methyltransferase